MNYKLVAYGGGGIFSAFMDLVILNTLDLKDAENFYVELRENQYNPHLDCFDFVFDQKCDDSYRIITTGFKGGFRKEGMGLGAIEDYTRLPELKACCKKFKIRKEIISQLIHLPDKTIGVHFRGADMDLRHSEYGVIKYEDYKVKLLELIRNYKPEALFVASDNDEVIRRFETEVKIPVFYYPDFIRAKTVSGDSYLVQLAFMISEQFWQEAFIDMLMLSRCNYLLCRTSNFSNAAIAFSDTLTKIYRL